MSNRKTFIESVTFAAGFGAIYGAISSYIFASPAMYFPSTLGTGLIAGAIIGGLVQTSLRLFRMS